MFTTTVDFNGLSSKNYGNRILQIQLTNDIGEHIT